MSLAAFNPARTAQGFVIASADKPRGRNLILDPEWQGRLRALYERTLTQGENLATWEYKHEVIAVARQLILNSPFKELPLGAVLARPISDRFNHQAFLEDTLWFVRHSDTRKMSINNWDKVLTFEDLGSKTPTHREMDKYVTAVLSPRRNEALLAEWLSKPNGYVDLVLTMKILFLAKG